MNTFRDSSSVQLCGTVDTDNEIDAVKILKENRIIVCNGYEFLELKIVVEEWLISFSVGFFHKPIED